MKRNSLVLFVLGALAALTAVSCAGPSGIQAYIPESAAVYAQVANMDALLANADDFVKEIGSQAMLNNKSFKEFLDSQLSGSMEGVSLSMFDLKKPVGAAVILPGASGGDPTIIVYLPMKDAKKDFETLKKAMGESDTNRIAQAGSYAIVYQSGEEMKFPPEKTLNISALSGYKQDSLSFVVNVKGLIAQYGAVLDAGIGAAAEELSTEGLSGGEDTAQMVEKFGKAFSDGIRQLDALNGALALTKGGLETRASLVFQKDSGLAKFAKALSASKGTAAYAKYLPGDHLISMASNTSPEARKMAMDFFMDFLGSIPGLEKADVDFYRSMEQKYSATMGNRIAAAFDLGVDGKALSALDEYSDNMDQLMQQVFDAFAFDVAMVMEAKDAPAYLEAMRSIYTDPAFTNMMNRTTQDTGLRITMAMEDKKDGELPYTALKAVFKVTSAKKLGLSDLGMDSAAMESVLSKVTEKIQGYMATSKDKLFMTMGDGGLQALTSLVKNDAHPEDLSKNPAYVSFAKIAGDDGQLMMRLSANKILSLVTSALSAKSGAVEGFTMPEGSNTGMWASVKAEGSSLKAVGFWSAKEIAAVVQQATTLYMSSIFSDSGDEGMYDEFATEDLGDWDGAAADSEDWGLGD